VGMALVSRSNFRSGMQPKKARWKDSTHLRQAQAGIIHFIIYRKTANQCRLVLDR
jgi:hypothetical protein